MSAGRFLQQAAAGNAGDSATYVDDVFSTYVYQGTGKNTFIENDIALSNTTDGGSAYFPSGSEQGSADQYPIQLDSNITLSGDFTIEMWIKRDGTATTGECILSPDYGSGGGNIQIGVRNSSDGTAPDALYMYTGGTYNGSTTNTVPPKAWTHIAYSRSGSTVYFWVNGVAAGTAATSYSFVINTIGALGGYGGGPVGYISNLRISNNARYTSAFTVPTSALSSDANTLLLILQGASPFTDQSGNKTLTVASTTEASTEGPFDSGEGGYGGLVWQKGRSTNVSHYLWDTERGSTKRLSTNNVNAEVTTDSSWISAFTSNGFSIGNSGAFNASGEDYVSWTFRKQPGFFDVVTYTGNGTNQTISHNLGSVPGMMIVKRMDSSTNGSWVTYHRSTSGSPQNDYMILQTTQGVNQWTDWNQTAPTSTEFSVGSVYTNTSGATYVAYLFAHDAQDFGTNSDESIIKCGTYTGNGSSTGVEVDLGFEPQWLLVKTASGSVSHKNWWLLDSMRGIVAAENEYLLAANLSDAETTGADIFDLTATGFIPKNGTQANQNGANYIYVAIRRPNKPASELTANDVFSVKTYAASTALATVTHDVAFDMEMSANRGVASVPKYLVVDHLRGINGRALRTSGLDAEASFPTYWSRKDQFTMYAPSAFDSWWAASSGTENHVSYAFKRTPEFFDIVAYRGTSSYPRQLSHNLGVAPELVIVKRRSGAGNGIWYSLWSSVGAGYYMQFTEATPTSTIIWNSTLPTASAITLNNNDVNSGSEDFVAYLFATAPGISKVGSYTGTGASLTIDCGFSSSARLVIIKSTTLSVSGADWYVWDSARGITASVDPYLRLNETNAESSTASLDLAPDSSGFTIVGTNTNINGSGEEYVFLAIA